MLWLKSTIHLVLGFILFSGALAFAETKTTGNLKVLTLNVFAGKQEMDFGRLKRQLDAVKELNPDIIALQETFDERVKAQYREAFQEFEAVESGRSNLAANLPNKLVGLMQGSFELANKMVGIASWSKGSRAILNGDTHGLMLLLNRKKGEVHHHTKMVKTYEVQAATSPATKLFEAVKPKAYIWIEYEVNGIRLLVINTHLSNSVHNERRMGQLAQLADDLISRDILAPNKVCSTIFCGDTNADGTEPEMRWWHEQKGFQDTYISKNPDLKSAPRNGMTWDNANPLTKGNLAEPDQRVDFISVRPSDEHAVEILKSDIVFDRDPVSDHYGVLTELKVTSICDMVLRSPNLLSR